MAARSKAWVCGPSIVGIAGSNPAVGMDVYLVRVVRYMSLSGWDHLSRGALSSAACLSVIVKPRQRGGPGPLALSSQEREES